MKYALEYFRVELLTIISYKMNFILEYVNQLVALTIKIQLWNAISSSSTGKFNYSYYIGYFLLVFIIGQFTTLDLSIADKIKSGDLSMELVKPININIIEFSKSFANKLVSVIKFLPLFITLSVIFIKDFKMFDLNWWFLIFLLLGFWISFLIQFLINCIAFWFVDVSAVKYIYSTIITIFSGALVPFEYMPEFIRELFSFLPFQFLINAPIASVMGEYTFNENCLYLILGIIYVIIFSLVNAMIFSLGIKKYTAVGG